jgi:hypothetical protein
MSLIYELWKKSIVMDENRGTTFQFVLICPKDTDAVKIAVELEGTDAVQSVTNSFITRAGFKGEIQRLTQNGSRMLGFY